MRERRILVIAREWRLRKLIQANLEAVGVEVLPAVNGRQGLELLKSTRPDLIVVDLDDWAQDAMNPMGSIRSLLADRTLPVIVMSSVPPGRGRRGEGPAVSHIEKPFAVVKLLEQIEQVLGQQSATAPGPAVCCPESIIPMEDRDQ